jgi:hypothetical protein
VSPPRLYVADSANNRVLVWFDALAAASFRPADLVLGQPDFQERPCASVPANQRLCSPQGVAVDSAGRVYVADRGNCRVVAFDRPMTNGPLIARAWGQPDTSTVSCIYLQNATTIPQPLDVSISPLGELFIAESAYGRVMGFAPVTPPAWPSAVPTWVFGQPSLTTNACTAVSCGINGQIEATSSRLYAVDTNRSRVLLFDRLPDAGWDSANPSAVLGQPRLDAGFYNYTPNASTFVNNPIALAGDTTGVWVSDATRVLRFDAPFVNGEAATQVLGAPDFTTNGSTAGSMVSSSAAGLFLGQSNRVVRYATPATGSVLSPWVFGQESLLSNDPNSVDSVGMNGPGSIAIDRTVTPNALWVSDSQNRRVLGWRTTNFVTGQPADVVIGAASFGSNPPSTVVGPTTFSSMTLSATNGQLFVSDYGNNRLLVFGANGGAPLAVFGQNDFSTNTCADGGLAAAPLCGNSGAAEALSDSVFLVPHGSGSRVLEFSFDGGVKAIGQDNLSLGRPGRVKAGGFDFARAVALDRSVFPNRLYVVDSNNNRLLVWHDVRQLGSGQLPDAVIG